MNRPTQTPCLGFRAVFAVLALAAPFAVLVHLVTPHCAFGDGGFIPPYGKDIWEPSQKALILYDDRTETEDLILAVDFEGDTEDFAWIVPVPSLPTRDTAEFMLFYDCADLTQPLESRRGLGCSGDRDDVVTPAGLGRDNDIQIYDRQTVGIYQTMTIGADNSTVLADSLEQWGYLHADNRQDVEEVLQFYIDKSWFFVTMKIDSVSLVAEHVGDFWHGPIDPIHLSFESDQIVYPLRISAISAKNPSEVLLYVCSTHRMTFPGAETEYANNLSTPEFERMQAQYRYLREYITEPVYLTKLRRTFFAAEMTDDLVLERASTDDEFRQVYGAGVPLTELLLLAMVSAIFVRTRRARKRENPAA